MPQLSMTTCLMIRSFRGTRISILAAAVLIFMMFNVSQTLAQKTTSKHEGLFLLRGSALRQVVAISNAGSLKPENK